MPPSGQCWPAAPLQRVSTFKPDPPPGDSATPSPPVRLASVSVCSESVHGQGHQEADVGQHSEDHYREQHSPRAPERGLRVQHNAREEQAGCEPDDEWDRPRSQEESQTDPYGR